MENGLDILYGMLNNESMDFDEAKKDLIGGQLIRRLARALQDGELTEEQVSEASGYILDTIDTIQDHSQLIAFLTTLSQKWPIFSESLALEQGEEKEVKEEVKLEEVQNLLRQDNLDEALKVAESATTHVDLSVPPPIEGAQPPLVTQNPQETPPTQPQSVPGGGT